MTALESMVNDSSVTKRKIEFEFIVLYSLLNFSLLI